MKFSTIIFGVLLSVTYSSAFTVERHSTARTDRSRLAARRTRTPRSKISQLSKDRQRERAAETAVVEKVFDGKTLTALQESNEASFQPLDLDGALLSGGLRRVQSLADEDTESSVRFGEPVVTPGFTFVSLESLFGSDFSDLFHENNDFRAALRMAIRQDIFDTTDAYSSLSEKAARILLLPDSSLQGSWRIPQTGDSRMKETTAVLRRFLPDETSLTGDSLVAQIGGLCGPAPSTHFIDIVGVQDRQISHSFHQDTGVLSEKDSRTVLWGFPPEDDYTGTGVFSHVTVLTHECHAPVGHPRMEPILFHGDLADECIIRPSFSRGKELLMYRDVDVLHSSPDVAYRMSLMRFM